MGNFAPHDLTSNTSHSPFVASASSEHLTLGAWQAFNGTGGYWLGTGGGADYLQLDLGAGNSQYLTFYSIQVNSIPEPARAPQDWTLQGSNDGSSWTTLHTVTGETDWLSGESRVFACTVTGTAYRYFRLDITANNGDVTYTQVAELYLYDEMGIVEHAGANVSKVVAYAVLGPEAGADVSKLAAYAVLGPEPGADVSKLAAYAVLGPEPGGDITKLVAYAVVEQLPSGSGTLFLLGDGRAGEQRQAFLLGDGRAGERMQLFLLRDSASVEQVRMMLLRDATLEANRYYGSN